MTRGMVSGCPMRSVWSSSIERALSEPNHLKAGESSFKGRGCLLKKAQGLGTTELQIFQARVGLCGGLQTLTHDDKSDAVRL